MRSPLAQQEYENTYRPYEVHLEALPDGSDELRDALRLLATRYSCLSMASYRNAFTGEVWYVQLSDYKKQEYGKEIWDVYCSARYGSILFIDDPEGAIKYWIQQCLSP
jgi:hypothetical protein